jgi:ribosomal-protein-alanine N-acetyltransferase
LWLRDFHLSDWPAVHKYACDPEVCRFMEWGPNSESETRRFVERATSLTYAEPRLDFDLAIIGKFDDKFLGTVSLHMESAEKREASLGYCLNRQAWGQGFATEAAYHLVNFGFERLRLTRIWATAAPENQGSINILQKLGMTHEQTIKDHKLVRGSWRDSELYALLQHQFVPPRRLY